MPRLVGFLATSLELEPAALTELESVSTPHRLAVGETLFRQGDPGDALYVFLSGRLEVHVDLPGGRKYSLHALSAGDLVGELSILTGQPRGATVVALEPTEVLGIPASTFRRVIEAYPTAHARLLDYASRRIPSLHLASSALLEGMNPDVLREFDRAENWLRLRGGETLFRQGDPADAMYVVVSGSVEVALDGANGGSRRVLSVLGRGSCVGELGLLLDEPRAASVRAVRDSELVRFSKEDFHRLLELEPRAGIRIAQALGRELRRQSSTPTTSRVSHGARTVAIVPTGSEPAVLAFGRELTAALNAQGATALHLTRDRLVHDLGDRALAAAEGDAMDVLESHWLAAHEQAHRHVLYHCDASDSPWTTRCLRQADSVMIVGLADGDASVSAAESLLDRLDVRAPRQLVLLHRMGTRRPTGTARWLERRAVVRHHHVRVGEPEDVRTVARFVQGTTLGVVLGGGGARGLAHIGAMRAIRDAGLAVDLIGGTSMGAIIGAQYAAGHSPEEMLELTRRYYTVGTGSSDWTVPVVALRTARATVRTLRAMFHDLQIEDLWRPYFCVSCSLSRAESVVHRTGPLWKWVRVSCAIPGVVPPLVENGELLVDGGLLNNLPIDVMRRFCEGTVFAVDVGPEVDLRTEMPAAVQMSGWPQLWRRLNPFETRAPFPSIVEILTRSAMISSIRDAHALRHKADLYLHPPVDRFGLSDFKAIDRIEELGYEETRARIREWQART